MMMRTAKQGAKIGSQFWGCSAKEALCAIVYFGRKKQYGGNCLVPDG